MGFHFLPPKIIQCKKERSHDQVFITKTLQHFTFMSYIWAGFSSIVMVVILLNGRDSFQLPLERGLNTIVMLIWISLGSFTVLRQELFSELTFL